MTNNKFGIILTTFNRYEYLEKTLETLSKTNFLPNTIIKIFDDCSTENKVIELLNNFNLIDNNVKLIKIFNKNNLGSKENYKRSIISFENDDIDYIVNLDSDCLLNKDWLIKLNQLINNFEHNIICSSFSCLYHHGNPFNYVKEIDDCYYERDTLNGLGVCFPKILIKEFKLETHKHFDEYLCKELKNKYNMRCICTKTSYIQHIGVYGVHSNPNTCDISTNFIGI